MATQLSKASPYEQKFGTRHRSVGRPSGDVEPVFPGNDREPLLVDVARRRAYALVHEENKATLNAYFEKELKVLERRGVEVVAADTGRKVRAAGDMLTGKDTSDSAYKNAGR